MAAHIFGVPVEEFLSASWGAIALAVGIVFAAGSLLVRRAQGTWRQPSERCALGSATPSPTNEPVSRRGLSLGEAR